MKSFIIAIAGMAFVAMLNATPASARIVVGKPKCDNGHGHCIYTVNGRVSNNSKSKVVCTERDVTGQGKGTCKFPDKSHATVTCNDGSKTTVKFGNPNSSFNSKADAYVIWNTEKKSEHPPVPPSTHSTTPHESLYVYCKA